MSHAKPLPKEFTADLAIASAQAFGARLAWLIQNAKISDEVKESLVALVPNMSAEQLDKLSELFMSDFLNQETADLDEKFKKEIEKLKTQNAKDHEKLQAKAGEELEKLEQKLKELSSKRD